MRNLSTKLLPLALAALCVAGCGSSAATHTVTVTRTPTAAASTTPASSTATATISSTGTSTAATTKVINCDAVNRQIDKVPSGDNLNSVAYSSALTDFAAYLTGQATKLIGTPASAALVKVSDDATTASNLASMDNVTKAQLTLAVNKITTDLQGLKPYCK